MKLLDSLASHLCFKRFIKQQQEFEIEIQDRPDMPAGPYVGVIINEDKHTHMCFVLIPFGEPLDSIYQYTHKSRLTPI